MELRENQERKTLLNPKSCAAAAAAAKYSHRRHDHLDAEVTTSMKPTTTASSSIAQRHTTQCAHTTGRRRKITALSGTLTARNDLKEIRSALQEREAAIQNLRIQLCLGKLPRPTGPPLDESERPAAEQKLTRLTAEVDNKKIKIRNLKSALEKLDVTDNIDTRIRQAELEYALGREELEMLSLVEEARALQARLEKSKPESQTLYGVITSGVTFTLHAVHATTGRWAAQTKTNQPGMFVEWALEGDGLYKGDRILEVNGTIVTCKTKDELAKVVGNSGKCQMVVLRKKAAPIPQKQLDQEKENSMRLQHRISYLEEQVKELQDAKERERSACAAMSALSGHHEPTAHVTSISITSPPSTPPDQPLIFQRGNYITTLVGGKPIELQGDAADNGGGQQLVKSKSTAHITKTLIKESRVANDCDHQRSSLPFITTKSLSASKISINSDSAAAAHTYSATHKRERERQRDRERERYERITSKTNALQQRAQIQARSVEHLNHYNGCLTERRREPPRSSDTHANTLRSVSRPRRSLDFDGELEVKPILDTMSEARSVRPTPPKKPLRLSLQRAQSLQTVEINPVGESDRKRPMKRAHITAPHITAAPHSAAADGMLIENFKPVQTSSLGRAKPNI